VEFRLNSLDLFGNEAKFQWGLDQFNSRAFFEAHETWEEIWLSAPEPDKTFLQGIIQLAAALHHCQRGNDRGARSLLAAGLGKLERFPEDYRGLRIAALRSAAQSCLATLAGGRRPGQAELPRIERAAGD
jgi:predicted metal-dependent hydrolase